MKLNLDLLLKQEKTSSNKSRWEKSYEFSLKTIWQKTFFRERLCELLKTKTFPRSCDSMFFSSLHDVLIRFRRGISFLLVKNYTKSFFSLVAKMKFWWVFGGFSGGIKREVWIKFSEHEMLEVLPLHVISIFSLHSTSIIR